MDFIAVCMKHAALSTLGVGNFFNLSTSSGKAKLPCKRHLMCRISFIRLLNESRITDKQLDFLTVQMPTQLEM